MVIIFVVLLSLPASLGQTMKSPPRILEQPPHEILYQVKSPDEPGNPFEIPCEAEGEPIPTYYWKKNGKYLNFTTYADAIAQKPGQGTLIFTRPRDNDEGHYQCFAENERGTASTNTVFLRKAFLNSFVQTKPQTIIMKEESALKLECQPPEGYPKPKISWIIQDTNGAIRTINSSRITTDPEGTLWFAYTNREDVSENFSYACVASNEFLNEYQTGNRINLWVEPIHNLFTSQYISGPEVVAIKGNRIEIFCIYGGLPQPEISWRKDGRKIRITDRIQLGNFGKSLVIKDTDFQDEGVYECWAESESQTTIEHRLIHLTVNSKPSFTVEPETVTVGLDETAEFQCQATGVPKPTIQWIFNGKPIEEMPPNPRRTVTSNRVTVHGIDVKDTGNYGCNASSVLGYVYKDVSLIVVTVAPELVEASRKIVATEGTNATLACRVFGAPRPYIKWINTEGAELTGSRFIIKENGDLVIRSVTLSDRGVYTCHAKNKYGEISTRIPLIVKHSTPEKSEVGGKEMVSDLKDPSEDLS